MVLAKIEIDQIEHNGIQELILHTRYTNVGQ